MADRKTPLWDACLVQYHHKNGIIPRYIRLHPSEYSMGIESQNKNNFSNDNKIAEVRHNILWRGTYRILTQIIENPITPVIICHGDLPSQSIPRNDHVHSEMVQKWLPLVHPDSVQLSQKRHQWPRVIYPILPNNTRIRSHILHSGATWSPIPQAKSTARNHKQHYFLPLDNALKLYPSKYYPHHSLRKLWPEIWKDGLVPFTL